MVDFKKLSDKTKKAKKGGALMSMKDIEKMYAVDAKAAADAAPVVGGVPIISTRGEQFQIGENLLPDVLELIVVAEGVLNIYYDSEYDPDNKAPPACFAVAVADKNVDATIVSHETSPNRQGGKDFKCLGCEMNAYGTAERGKGKACANKRNLAVVFADDKAIKSGEGTPTWGFLQLPPTSLSDWGKFIQGLDRVERRPPHGVIIKFTFDRKNPNERLRKRVIAIGYQKIDDPRTAMSVNALRKEILESGALTRPIPVDGYVAPGEKKPVVARGKAAPAKKRAAIDSKASTKGKSPGARAAEGKKRAAAF